MERTSSASELLVVGEDVSVLTGGDLDDGIITMTVALDDLLRTCQSQCGLGETVGLLEVFEFTYQGSGYNETHLAQQFLYGEV